MISTDLTSQPDREQLGLHQWTPEEDVAVNVWIALSRCYASYARALAVKMQEYGLTMPQFRALQMLYHLGPMRLGELADKLLVTCGNVTYVMDSLQKKGPASRRRSLTDRRIVHATLTESGRALLDEMCNGYTGYLHHLSRHLPEEELEAMPTLLKQLGKGIALHDL